MMNLTAKIERFAQEIANGASQSDAYRIAYPKSKKWKDSSVHVEASKLASLPKVILRLESLRKEVSLSAKYDREAHFKELDELKQSTTYDNIKAKMVEQKGKLCGLYVDRSEIDAKVTGNIVVNIKTNGE